MKRSANSKTRSPKSPTQPAKNKSKNLRTPSEKSLTGLKNFYNTFYKFLSNFFHNHPYWFTFLLSTLLALLMFLPNVIMNGGIFGWIGDYSLQEIPFNTHLNETIKSGGEQWEPHNDLGASTIGSYSFYNLASPFMIVLWLFPAEAVPYLMVFMYALKYGVTGLTAFMFLRRMVKNPKYALLGALLYSFSGFQLTNMLFYHFHDAVALFPLLLYGLDRFMKEDKHFIFLFAVALNLFTNYFFFIGEVVFLVIYFAALCITDYYKFTWKKFFLLALESIIGVGLACIILVPSLLFVVNNPRLGGGWTLKTMFNPGRINLLEILRALILPNESMSFHSVVVFENYSSIEAYLPFVGSILWLSYLIKKPKNPFSILSFTLLIILFIPILNSTFIMFSATAFYTRWLYMLILILSMLSAKALEEKVSLKPGFIATGVILTAFLTLAAYTMYHGVTIIHRDKYFFTILTVFVVDLLILACLNRQRIFSGVMIGVCAYIVFYGGYFCLINRANIIDHFHAEKDLLASYEDNVRYNEGLRNGSYFSRKMAVTSWNSNIEGTAFEFYRSIDLPRIVVSEVPSDEHDLQDFLSVKYLLVEKDVKDPERPEGNYALRESRETLDIYENLDYLPFGIDYDTYLTKDEFFELPIAERRKVLKDAIILSPDQVEKYKDILKPYADKSRSSKISSNNFELIKNGFKSDIELKKDALVVYSFAFSNNFQATLNGEPVELENVDNGLIGVKLHSGMNHLEVVYVDKGLKLGVILSGISVVALIGYAAVVHHSKNRAS